MSARGGSKSDLKKVIEQLQTKVMALSREALMQREYIAHEIYAMHCRHTDCQPYAWKDLDPRHRNEYRERADDAVKRFHSMEISSMNDRS